VYKIYAIKGSIETLIYNDVTPELTTTKLIDPKLTMTDNAAGSLTCKIPQGNAIYNTVEPMTVTIRITRDDQWLWTGRVLTIKKDFWLNKEITAEGALAFLNDTALKQRKWYNLSTDMFVQAVLNMHNVRVPESRRIKPGAISTSTSSGSPIGLRDYVSNGESPLKHISTLAEDWGLHMRIREYSGELYLDMLTDAQLPSSNQEIDFGKNLLDYMDETDWSDLITVLHPLGAELETTVNTGDEEYPDKLTIKGKTPSDTTTFGVIDDEYLYNKAAVQKFGRIEETVEWSEVDDANTLIALSELYLNDFQYYDIKLTINVIDLHYLTSSTQPFLFLSKIFCKSKPHNLSDEFIINKMEIPFDKPENTQFSFSRSTMGYYTSDRPTQGFGKGTISGTAINVNTFSKGSVLKAAKENAMQMIYANLHGFVSLNMDENDDHVENLTITNRLPIENATQRWIWSLGGLAYQERSGANVDWGLPNVAITMDGQIVANMITTGVLRVASSSSGVLFSADMTNNTVRIAGFTVQDNALHTYNKTTLDSNSYGVYVGTDGVSTSSGSLYMCMANGELYGAYNGQYGYISFKTPEEGSGTLGLVLAGRGYVGVMTGGWIGFRNGWNSRDYTGVTEYDSGTTGSLTLYNGDGSVYTILEFTCGLCTGWHV